MDRGALAATLLTVLIWTFPRPGMAIPAFARWYDVGCDQCHEAWPRLNKTGFMFRAMGYRMPDETGKDKSPEIDRLLDALSVRGQASFGLTRKPEGGAVADIGTVDLTSTEAETSGAERTTASAPRRQHVHGGSVEETETGPLKTRFGFGAGGMEFFQSALFAQHFSDFFHAVFFSGAGADIESASLRGHFGGDERFVQVKAGTMHPLEAFSALDHPIALSGPMIVEAPAEGTVFTFAGPSQLGVVVGGGYGDSLASMAVFNGLDAFGRGTAGFEEDNISADLELSFIHFLGNTGGAVQAVGYLGNIDKPAVPGNDAAGMWRNDFRRAVLAANYPVMNSLSIVAGGGIGKDDDFDFGQEEDFKSLGFFFEADTSAWDYFVPMVRYDYHDSSTKVRGVHQAITLGCSVPHKFLRAAFEYRFLRITGEETVATHAAQVTLDFAY